VPTFELTRRETVAALAATAAFSFLPGCKARPGTAAGVGEID